MPFLIQTIYDLEASYSLAQWHASDSGGLLAVLARNLTRPLVRTRTSSTGGSDTRTRPRSPPVHMP